MNNTADDKYQIKIESFEGPFDLLLYLVKNSKINVSEISISEITMQFLQFLNDRLVLDIEESSLFIFMVSSLMNIKSKTLLPQEIEIEAGSITKSITIEKAGPFSFGLDLQPGDMEFEAQYEGLLVKFRARNYCSTLSDQRMLSWVLAKVEFMPS